MSILGYWNVWPSAMIVQLEQKVADLEQKNAALSKELERHNTRHQQFVAECFEVTRIMRDNTAPGVWQVVEDPELPIVLGFARVKDKDRANALHRVLVTLFTEATK